MPGALLLRVLPLTMLVSACASSVVPTGTDVYYQEGPQPALEFLHTYPTVEADTHLVAMERAVMLQELGEYAASTELLLATAEALERTGLPAGDVALKILVNDGAATYRGEYFERVFLHTLALANLLALQEVDAAVAEAECALQAVSASGCQSCRFPFTQYLASAAFAADGRLDRAAEVLSVAAASNPEITFIRTERDRLDRETVYARGLRFMAGPIEPPADHNRHLVLLLLLGRGPFKVEVAVALPPSHLLAWPRYEPYPGTVSAARIHLAGVGSRWSTPLTDVPDLATASLRSRLDGLLARQGVSTVAHEVAVTEVGKAHGWLAEAALRTMLASADQADLRYWSTLPAECHVLRVPVPEAAKTAELVFTGPDGREVDREILVIPDSWTHGDLFVTRRVP